MDYDKILDEWADAVYKEMDKAIETKDTEKFGSHKFFLNDGYSSGLAMSIAIFNRIERKHKRSKPNEQGDILGS